MKEQNYLTTMKSKKSNQLEEKLTSISIVLASLWIVGSVIWGLMTHGIAL